MCSKMQSGSCTPAPSPLIQALSFTKANSISLRISLQGNPYGERVEEPDLNLITVQRCQGRLRGTAGGESEGRKERVWTVWV